MEIVGEVIDITCYLSHSDSGKGEEHKACAEKCIKSHLPVGILEEKTENVYLAATATHESAEGILLPYVAETVKVTGELIKGKGVNLILIKTVEKMKK